MSWEVSATISVLAVAVIFAIFSQTLDDRRNLLNRPIKFLFFFLALGFLAIALHLNMPLIDANNSTLGVGVIDDLDRHISLAYWLTFYTFVLTLLYYTLVFIFGVVKKSSRDSEGEDDF